MSKSSTRGLARKELFRAQGNLATMAEHIQRVFDSHYQKGYAEIDQLLELVREGVVGVDQGIAHLLERI